MVLVLMDVLSLWSASGPLAFGVCGILMRSMHVPLHLLVVLLCSVYGALFVVHIF